MTKKIKNIIITGIAGATIAGGVVLHSLPTSKVPCIEAEGQKICFPYTDDNSGENLLIYTDRQDYVNGDYIYFAINNKSIAQTARIAGFFAKDNQYISDIEVLIKDVPYLVKIPEYTTTTYDCSYYSSTTNEVVNKTCQKRKIIGYRQEIRYKDKWIPLKMVKYNPLKTISHKVKVKSKNGYKAVKELQHYLPEGFTYFRGKVHAPMMMRKKTEFFIEVIGEKGYGHIDPFLSGYTTRRKLTIDHTKIDSDLTDFPVLVKLTSSNFDFSKSNSDGYDIRFCSSDGTTLLKYERERHDSTNEVAEYWVKIPSVSSSADTEFYIYYRTDDTADGADPTNVWDSHFKGVWHLKEDPSGTAPQMKDSTSLGNDLIAYGSMTSDDQVEGKIDGSLDFDGSDDYLQRTDDNFDVSNVTVSLWFKITGDLNVNHYLLGLRADNKLYCYHSQDNDWLAFGIYAVTGGSVEIPQSYYDDGAWHHLAATYDGSILRGYLDGTEIDTNSDVSGNLNSGNDLYVASRYSISDFLQGLEDELRISDTARSVAWIKATYNSENDTLLTYGSEETEGVGSSQPVIIDSF